MSTPAGESAFLRRLEIDVRANLAQAETSPPEDEAVEVPVDEWVVDPLDAERYELRLRNLLFAVETLEDDSGPEDQGRPGETDG